MTLEEAFKKYENQSIDLRRKSDPALFMPLSVLRALHELKKIVKENIERLEADDWEVVE